MNQIRLKTAPSREKRHDTITAFIGESGALLAEYEKGTVQQRIRTFAQSADDDLVKALAVVSGIRNSVIIIHGPEGCSSGFYHLAGKNSQIWASTQLDERDTIMGADEKLRSATAELYNRHRPKCIVIVATPSVAINNDDIQSVVDELSDELGIPVIPVFVSGFSSKAGISGNDMALHSLLKYTSEKETPSDGSPFLNLISVGDLTEDIQEIRRLLDAMNINYQVLPDFAEPFAFANAHHAAATAGLDDDTAEYAGTWLQQISGVTWLAAGHPVGLIATREWLLKIAEHFGFTGTARELHASESSQCAHVISEAILSGKRVFIEGPPAKVFGIHSLIHELGGKGSGLSITHFDRLHLASLKKIVADFPQITIQVGDNQIFETVNLIKRDIPDLFVGTARTAVHTAVAGIPSVSIDNLPVLGYSGFCTFERAVRKALNQRGYINSVSGALSPYKAAWYQRSSNWHIKQEVK